MTKLLKCLLSALLLVSIIVFSAFSVSAAEVTVDSHQLSVDIPNEYTVLTLENAEDNAELIESLGYTVESFKNHLLPTKENPTETLFLALTPDGALQISLKSWETEFSKDIGDFYPLDDSSLFSAAEKLVVTKNAQRKVVEANGMKLVEVRFNSKDSGGDFCSVQYFTIKNQKYYSLNFNFSGKLSSQKVQSAWDTLVTMHIGTKNEKTVWDVSSVLMVIFLSVGIVVGVGIAVIIIISIVKDIKKRRDSLNENTDYIARRK